MSAPFNIPLHTNCTNCGECCGLLPLTASDVTCIESYIRSHKETERVMKQQHEPMECMFRDNEKKCCSIYPVRPMVCRLFGVTAGMKCPNGNSAEIDGRSFVPPMSAFVGFQNDIFAGYTL